MQQIQQQIALLHNLFMICLGISIVCLMVSVLFFFCFDIRGIFDARTGRSIRKTVKKMEEINDRTGQLRMAQQQAETGKQVSKARKVNVQGTIASPEKNTSAFSIVGDNIEVLDYRQSGYSQEEAQKEIDQSHGKFELVKYILLIHTNEAG